MGTVLEKSEHESLDIKENFENMMEIEKAAFTWGFSVRQSKEDDANKKQDLNLQKINFSLKQGERMCVIGHVGSGKTSLLYSILNELIKVEGNLQVNGNCAYVEQEPFIMSATVQDNICFGKTYDKESFDKVIEACELGNDMRN